MLDFGLAKGMEPAAIGGMDATASPTITSPAMMTGVGMLLGTAAYMSPEQARGKGVTRATDIFAFGAVLYEMLTGGRAFQGEDTADVLAAVMKTEPDWSKLPAHVPLTIRTLLRRCLRKERQHRLADAGSVRIELEDILAGTPGDAVSFHEKRSPRLLALALTIAGLMVTGVVGGLAMWSFTAPSQPPSVTRFTISLPPGEQLAALEQPAIATGRNPARLYSRPRWNSAGVPPADGCRGCQAAAGNRGSREYLLFARRAVVGLSRGWYERRLQEGPSKWRRGGDHF